MKLGYWFSVIWGHMMGEHKKAGGGMREALHICTLPNQALERTCKPLSDKQAAQRSCAGNNVEVGTECKEPKAGVQRM